MLLFYVCLSPSNAARSIEIRTHEYFLRARHLLCEWQYFIPCQNSMAATKQICFRAQFLPRFLLSLRYNATDKEFFSGL